MLLGIVMWDVGNCRCAIVVAPFNVSRVHCAEVKFTPEHRLFIGAQQRLTFSAKPQKSYHHSQRSPALVSTCQSRRLQRE
jgi:hypothetical protein